MHIILRQPDQPETKQAAAAGRMLFDTNGRGYPIGMISFSV